VSTLRVGLLGCGGIGARHAAAVTALAGQMQLVACCGRDPGKVEAFATKFAARPFTDFRGMLDSAQLDLLIVALPPFAHAGEVEAAADAGVHLLVEKPIALHEERADAMVAAAHKARIVAACGFMYRFGDAVMRWDAAKAADEVGRVGLFAGQFHCNALHAPWWRERARSGGQMVEQLIHIVDLARHQLGEPRHVYARAANFFHREVAAYDSDDVSAIVLGYDDERIGVLNATNGAVPGTWEKLWQIVGERMTARFTGWNTATLTHTAEDPPRSERIDTQTDVFVSQLADIAAAIRDHRAPRVPLADGAKSLRIVLAARRSAGAGREIAL
jgi:predicted dehydrogenase